MTTATRSAREVTVRAESEMPAAMSAEDLKAQIDAQLQAALDEAMTKAAPEVAEPYPWWNLYAIGPIQPGAHMAGSLSGPLLPHQIIRVGQSAYVVTVLLLNPFYPVPSAAEILSTFKLPYEVTYRTANLSSWQPGPANLQTVNSGNFTPGRSWAIDVFEFKGQDEGLFEMNISSRIFGCDKEIAPPFAGFVRNVYKVDSSLFIFEPNVTTDTGVRFQVYR